MKDHTVNSIQSLSCTPPQTMIPAHPSVKENVVLMVNDKEYDSDFSQNGDTSQQVHPEPDMETFSDFVDKEYATSPSNKTSTVVPPQAFGPLTSYVDRENFQENTADSGSGKTFGLGSLSDLKNAFGTHSYDGLKLFVRNNNWPVDHSVRKKLWISLINHMNQDAVDDTLLTLYHETVHTIFRGKSKCIHVHMIQYI